MVSKRNQAAFSIEGCFQTHMPLSEFSVEEQEKLLEGVWFDTMTDVFHYLESFSS